MKGRRPGQHLALCGLALLGWGLLASPLLHSLEHALGRRHTHGGARPQGRVQALGAQEGPPLGLMSAGDGRCASVADRSSDAHWHGQAAPHEHPPSHGPPHERAYAGDHQHERAHAHPHERTYASDHQHEREGHADADEPLDAHGAGSLEHLMLAGLEALPLPWPALAPQASARAPSSPPAPLALATRHRPEQPQGP